MCVLFVCLSCLCACVFARLFLHVTKSGITSSIYLFKYHAAGTGSGGNTSSAGSTSSSSTYVLLALMQIQWLLVTIA